MNFLTTGNGISQKTKEKIFSQKKGSMFGVVKLDNMVLNAV